MIVSSGYNIAAPEVENALYAHEAVQECAVIGAPCEERGQKVKAFVVLAPGYAPDARHRRRAAGPCEGGDRALQISARDRLRRRRCPRPRPASSSASRCANGKASEGSGLFEERAEAGKTGLTGRPKWRERVLVFHFAAFTTVRLYSEQVTLVARNISVLSSYVPIREKTEWLT